MLDKRRFAALFDDAGSHRALMLAILILIVMVGATIGSMLAAAITDSNGAALMAEYAQNLTSAKSGVLPHAPLWLVLLDNLKYPIILFVMGFSVIGTFTVPAAVACKGFFLSYTVSSYVRIAGNAGFAFAIAYEGLQNIILLPAILCLASDALANSASIFAMSTGVGKKLISQPPDKRYFIRASIAFALAILAAAVEVIVTPWLVICIASML